MTPLLVIAAVALAVWLYLLAARGHFWLGREIDSAEVPPPPEPWPAVTAIIPARDEAGTIAQTLGSLMAQTYPGPFRIILVDDNSSDGTAEIAARVTGPFPLEIISGAPLAPGWTGKLWAVSQGVARAELLDPPPDFLWLTDADIVHSPDNLSALAARAAADGLDLVSLMALLRVDTLAERLLIPAFVFFFQMLFPFAWVNDRRRTAAAAAGGCVLVRRAALAAAGGLGAIRGAIIDDCALAALIKPRGPVWLGLTRRAVSVRPYPGLADIAAMVARSAYAQLRFSPLLLAGTVAGMSLIFLSPPLLLLAPGAAAWLGAAACAAMLTAFQPTLNLYRLSPLWALALPLAALLYTAFTIASAVHYWRGRGGLWKGRVQAFAPRDAVR